MVDFVQYHLPDPPTYLCRWCFNDDWFSMTVQSTKPLPNRWRRFWYWALLNMRWEKLP